MDVKQFIFGYQLLVALRSIEALLQDSGLMSNLRVCRKTSEVVPVLPLPDPALIWAPQRLCIAPPPR